jgi:ABC-type polysaccharide/polyol phosphate transport system ATPase subunit
VTAILELGAGFQPDYTGRENVLLNGMMLGISEQEMNQRMSDLASFADVGDFFDQPLRTYSSGMAMRLAFASAISVDPDILIIDEALAVGDERFQLKCFEKIDQLKIAGKTIIFVSHNTKAVEQFCQKAVLLNGGRVIADGSTKEIVPLYEKLMSGDESVAPKTFTQPILAR